MTQYCNYYSGPLPYTEADCMDDCQLTYCQACYYSNTTLPAPPGCRDRTMDKGCLCCLREWTRCVETRNKRDNEVHIIVYKLTLVHYHFIIIQCTGTAKQWRISNAMIIPYAFDDITTAAILWTHYVSQYYSYIANSYTHRILINFCIVCML